MSTELQNPPISLHRALRELAAAQRTIERIARQFPAEDMVTRRLDGILTLILHLPLDDNAADAQSHPKCSICQHTDRASIEAMMLRGDSLRKMVRCFPTVSKSALSRHFGHPWRQSNQFDLKAWRGY